MLLCDVFQKLASAVFTSIDQQWTFAFLALKRTPRMKGHFESFATPSRQSLLPFLMQCWFNKVPFRNTPCLHVKSKKKKQNMLPIHLLYVQLPLHLPASQRPPFGPYFRVPLFPPHSPKVGEKKDAEIFIERPHFYDPQKAATKVSILRSKENIKASTFPLKGMCLYFSFCERASRNHTQNFYAPRFHLKYKGPLPDNFSSCPSGHFRVKFPPAADQKMRGRQKV